MRSPKATYHTGIAILICLTILLSGCDIKHPSSDKVIADLQSAIDEAQTRLSELAPSGEDVQKAATKELGKLYAIEYKVVSFRPDLSATELERQLIALGEERWDCGQPLSVGGESRIICRRIPLSYLKLLAQFARVM